ncbi:MAG: arginase family protein [Nitrososphaera sp.]|nr:arginase family protein [Nitrososphaera sp.]
MRKCLAPFFVGREEAGLDRGTGPFDVVLPGTLVDPEPGSKSSINSVNRAIREFVAETVVSGERPLVLSGDCLCSIGCIAGLQRCGIRPQLLWFDAHGDFHTPETTISAHLGGMPLAMITGRGDLSLLEAVGLTPLVDADVFHIGARDLEPGEKEALETSGIDCMSRITDILNVLPKRSPCWVHFDTDYINPSDAPAMRYPASGGISSGSAKSDFDALARRAGLILGLSISAWAPRLDVEARTAVTCWNTVSGLAAI